MRHNVMNRVWIGISGLVARRYRTVIATAVVLTVVLAFGAPLLRFETSQNALIGGSSQTAKDNAKYQRQFGGEAMLVLYTGPVEKMFTTQNIARMQALTRDLEATGLYKYVLSPLTALQFAQAQLGVGQTVIGAAAQRHPADAAKYGAIINTESGRLAKVTGPQQLDNPAFVRYLLYDETGRIRPILRDNFVDPNHAVMVVRLHGNEAMAQMGKATTTAKKLVAEHPLAGVTALATGSPVMLKEINDYLQGGLTSLGALSLLVMIVVLFLVFRVRSRLLSLGCVVMSAIATFGIMGFIGLPLNMVTISGLPILIGMGVDFAIQMHSRFEEEAAVQGSPRALVGRVTQHLAPALAIAMLAAVIGFVAMQISRVPMIRQFGVMLDIGVAVIFVVVLFVPLSWLVWREHRKPTVAKGRRPLEGGVLERGVRGLATAVHGSILPVVVIAGLVVVAGLFVEGRPTIQTDPEKWIPQSGNTEKSLKALRASTNTSTELDFLVEAPDVTATPVAEWMQRYASEQVAKHPKELLRGSSLGAVVTSVTRTLPGQPEVQALEKVAPNDVRIAFLSNDHTRANLIFPIANIPLSERGKLLDQMKADLHPPAGVRATPAGLAVVGVALVHALQANRTEMTFLALVLVALWLLLVYRSLAKVLLTLVPVLVAVGLSAIVVYATGLELSPLTSVAGPLVIAVGTEFAVLIATRYVEERERGRTPADAVRTGIVRIGRAFVASGLTLVGGFAVIATSRFPLLRDFGIIVALNTLVALLVALVLLPPLLVWADGHPRIKSFSPGPGLLGIPTEPMVVTPGSETPTDVTV
jgi:uncharacterized protein